MPHPTRLPRSGTRSHRQFLNSFTASQLFRDVLHLLDGRGSCEEGGARCEACRLSWSRSRLQESGAPPPPLSRTVIYTDVTAGQHL